ncbi:unnamed protein product [Peronospora belbahrii]|uniref:CWF21 domain-containing protein n=1 Tax=Peronospora belbahrii TaxID=622444 RepID=A0AAU9KR73_9STRA|nr:unnamed protein product [Peronospora belbahrii]
MSTCPQCYTGTCKRHKLQDNGRSVIKSTNAESTLQKMYDQLVGSKLQRLQAEAENESCQQHTHEFRKKLDASRDKIMRKSHGSQSKLGNVSVSGSGLNPQALAAIYGEDSSVSDEEEDEKKKKRRCKHFSTFEKKRRRIDREGGSFSDDNDDEAQNRQKSSSSLKKHSRHSHYKKSHKMKKHQSRRADGRD